MRLIFAMLLVCGCAEALPSPRPFISEVGAGVAIDIAPLQGPYETIVNDYVPKVRRMPGNHAVYIVQGTHDGAAAVWIISVWDSPQSLERCNAAGLCSGRPPALDVLYLATQ